jgi:hypothetical protein
MSTDYTSLKLTSNSIVQVRGTYYIWSLSLPFQRPTDWRCIRIQARENTQDYINFQYSERR